jgi:HEAT repeat protein
MRSTLLRSLAGAALAAVLVAAPSLDAAASPAERDFHACATESWPGGGECQHYLRNPAGATDDPCWCDKCRNGVTGQNHDGKTIPSGWTQQVFEKGGMECYLKRHSVAWGITCSECMQNDKPWPDGTSEKNVGTVPAKDWAGRPAKPTVLGRLEKEQRFFKKPEDVVVAYNRHFYVVSDVDGLKTRTPTGMYRPIARHEWVHLMIERAEYARREWARNLGPLMTELQKPNIANRIPEVPIAMFFTEKQRDYEKISADYFKAPASKGLKGSGINLCDGMCLSGLGMSKEKFIDDHGMTIVMRHQLSHNLFALWSSWETRPKSLPVWMDEGLAHWLTKATEKFRDEANFCTGEGAAGLISYPRKNWDKDVARWVAAPGRLRPIEELLGKTVVSELTEEDVKRSWSYFDFCLAEWREPFVKMLAALRQEKDVREAFTSNLGMTPEAFDARWRDRVAGKRKTMAPTDGDGGPGAEEAPGARDRASIRDEKDPKVLAAKVRQLGEIKDRKTVPVVVDVMAQSRDLPRETALVTLLKMKDPGCREELVSYGLSHPDGVVRAYVARICGRLGLTAALPLLEAQLEDKNWYARSEAAIACGTMKHVKAMAGMRKIASSDSSEKARIGACDALALFREDAAASVPVVAKLLDHSQWQLRSAAAQTLGEIGSMEAIDPLIARMDIESGRVRDDIYEALKKISRDDLGRKPEHWKAWWTRAKSENPGGLPKRPPAPEEKKKPKFDPNDPRATSDVFAPYFGIELYSNRVAFVMDTSESMLESFEPDPAAAAKLGFAPGVRSKLEICKEEVVRAFSGLDPRAHFNIVSFGTQIRAFRPQPVQASPGNVAEAKDHLERLQGDGETNYYDALRTALEIGEEPDTDPDLKSTPDTITFLTDGEPTRGDILDADTILEWYTGLDRYARVRTHTITFGTIDVDVPLLRAIAERNGGRFTLVAQAPAKK